MDKAILVVCDGLGDRPIKILGNKTPLEKAKTPNLDKLAREGITGLMDVIEVGVRPGSDVAHLSLLGFDPLLVYSGRGPFEAAGIGMELKKGDIAFRANLGTVDKREIIIDRRAGRIKSTKEFVNELNGLKIDGVTFFVKAGTCHRAGVVMRGKGLSSQVSDADPHISGVKVLKVKPLDNSKEAKFTANVLNKFLEKASKILEKNPLNKKRKLPANYLLVRGAGESYEGKSFEERFGLRACCVAGAGLYKGIAKCLGMKVLEVKGATGMPDTDVRAKFRAAKNALKEFDFVFVHVKAADNLAEDGDFLGKTKFIEKIDKAAKELTGVNALIAVTADHSTPSELKMHSADPVPLLIKGEGVRVDEVKRFGERECSKGGMHRILGLDLMFELINLMGKSKLYGA